MSTAEAKPIIFIVDDDHAMRDSLTLLLGLRGYSTRAFASGSEFLSNITESSHGCVLLDLRMAGVDGLGVQRELAMRNVNIPIIILTAHGDVATARTALKAGAFDFLEKPFDDAVLRTTIEAALVRDREAQSRASEIAELQTRLERLTAREREVLELVARGRHNREVGVELGISPRTVEVYKARVMDKLQVDRLPDLIRILLELERAAGPHS